MYCPHTVFFDMQLNREFLEEYHGGSSERVPKVAFWSNLERTSRRILARISEFIFKTTVTLNSSRTFRETFKKPETVLERFLGRISMELGEEMVNSYKNP